MSPCYSLEICIQMGISFLFSFVFCFSSFITIYKASSDNHFAFLHFFFLEMVLITTSCTMLRTSIHSSSGILSYQIESLESVCHFHCVIVRDLIQVIPKWSSGFPCFLWQEYTEELYRKELHDPDNHDDVITHLEPDILECEVKQALESITTNKTSGGDGNPVELFQILNDDAVKVLHSICQQIWKTQQWPQDWKRSVFILIPRKGNAKKMLKLPQNCTHLTHQ